MVSNILFFLFLCVAAISALFLLFSKNILYSAFSLALTLLCIAALYVFLSAEFLAVAQIMIYVGGIIVLMIFGIMLTNKLGREPLVTAGHNWFWAIVLSIGLFAVLIHNVLKLRYSTLSSATASDNIKKVGVGMMSDHILPFEVSAVILLIALLGAVTIASKNKSKS